MIGDQGSLRCNGPGNRRSRFTRRPQDVACDEGEAQQRVVVRAEVDRGGDDLAAGQQDGVEHVRADLAPQVRHLDLRVAVRECLEYGHRSPRTALLE